MPELDDPVNVPHLASNETPVRVAPIMWRMSAWSFCSALAISAAAFIVCLKTGPNQWRLYALLGALFGVNLAFLLPWFYGALRRAGYPLSFTIRLAQWQVAAVYGTSLLGAIVLTHFVYRWTASRIVEGLMALCFVPLFIVLFSKGYALQPKPKPWEAGMLRWGFLIQLVSTIVFGASLVLQLLPERHHNADLERIRDWVIAGYFVIIPLNPIAGYFMRERYLRARALATPLPPAMS